MRIEEVQEVNQIIRAGPTDTVAPTMEAGAQSDRRAPRLGLGVGLTGTEGDFRVAVRVADETEEEWFRTHYAKLIRERGKDNIEVKIVGNGGFLESALRRSTGDSESPSQVTGELKGSSPATKKRGAGSLQIGSAVRHVNGPKGTLAFFATREGKQGIVSCNHIFARRDRALEGDQIVSDQSGEVIALLAGIEDLRGDVPPRADCAFAELLDPKAEPKSPGRVAGKNLVAGSPRLEKFLPVLKIGAVTGVTRGLITAFGISYEVDYGRFFAKFTDLIEIESTQKNRAGVMTPFATDGDSGALVVADPSRNPIGMLFYRTIGGPGNSGVLFANPLSSIETALGVTLHV